MFVGLQTRWMSLISISAQSAALHAHPEATRSLQATSRIPHPAISYTCSTCCRHHRLPIKRAHLGPGRGGAGRGGMGRTRALLHTSIPIHSLPSNASLLTLFTSTSTLSCFLHSFTLLHILSFFLSHPWYVFSKFWFFLTRFF